jgi:hypothetical protein
MVQEHRGEYPSLWAAVEPFGPDAAGPCDLWRRELIVELKFVRASALQRLPSFSFRQPLANLGHKESIASGRFGVAKISLVTPFDTRQAAISAAQAPGLSRSAMNQPIQAVRMV